MSEAFKQHLLDCVKQEKVSFTKIADHFYKQIHRPKQSYVALCEAVITTVDRIAAMGDLESSAFLKNTFTPLQKLQTQAKALYKKLTGVKGNFDLAKKLLMENQEKCFISLYQNKGHDLKQWALQLASIDKYMMGRPIYRNEADVQKVLRLKLSQAQEAYVVVAVDRNKMIDQGVKRQDRMGNDLVTLPMGSVKAENILEFVHVGRRYGFANNTLVPIER